MVARVLALLRPVSPDDDPLLDFWICEALRDEAGDVPSAGAWDRLCRTIIERHFAPRHGMWILEEPFRDPPEVSRLSQRQLARAQHLYEARRAELRARTREAAWSNLMPPFAVLLNV